ncbi:MAG: hypothetical protein RR248_03805 [Clostridia bacterium]
METNISFILTLLFLIMFAVIALLSFMLKALWNISRLFHIRNFTLISTYIVSQCAKLYFFNHTNMIIDSAQFLAFYNFLVTALTIGLDKLILFINIVLTGALFFITVKFCFNIIYIVSYKLNIYFGNKFATFKFFTKASTKNNFSRKIFLINSSLTI